ncbi:D-alanyl-D-alanine carboxypeptidase, partial [Bacillus toyonensis]|nr:D-alanyl-D-alanine carboxypeptidase [Bacillus toyonensis]
MKKHRQITFTGLTLLITGGSLFYTTPTSSVKAELTQNLSSSLPTSNQRD